MNFYFFYFTSYYYKITLNIILIFKLLSCIYQPSISLDMKHGHKKVKDL